MAAPVPASTSSHVVGNGNSIATSAPSGVSVGDLLLLCVGTEISTTITPPSPAWTQIDQMIEGGTAVAGGVWRRIADGTADDTPTVSLADTRDYDAFIMRITGHDAASPIGVHSSFSDNTSDAAFDHPDVTVGDNDSLGLIFVVGANGTGSLSAYPAGWTSTIFHDAGAFYTYTALKTLAAGATGTGTITFTLSQRKVGFIVAIKPATGGGTVVGKGSTQSNALSPRRLVA